MGYCVKVLKSNEADDERLFIMAAMVEIKPHDAFERMLAVQMVATHVAMIWSGKRRQH